LDQFPDLRWDDAVQIVLDENRLADVRKRKKDGKANAGNFALSEDDE
jgi:hypothetical protein